MADSRTLNITLSPLEDDLSGAMMQRKITLSDGGSIQIGRASSTSKSNYQSPNNAYINSPVVSRDHALITRDKDSTTVYITDRSMHGTKVNTTKLHKNEQYPLKSGDVLQIGEEVIRGSDTFYAPRLRFEVSPVKPHTGIRDTSSSAPKRANNPPSRTYSVPSDSDSDDDMDAEGEEEEASDTSLDHASSPLVMEQSGTQGNPVTIFDEAEVGQENIVVLSDDEDVPKAQSSSRLAANVLKDKDREELEKALANLQKAREDQAREMNVEEESDSESEQDHESVVFDEGMGDDVDPMGEGYLDDLSDGELQSDYDYPRSPSSITSDEHSGDEDFSDRDDASEPGSSIMDEAEDEPEATETVVVTVKEAEIPSSVVENNEGNTPADKADTNAADTGDQSEAPVDDFFKTFADMPKADSSTDPDNITRSKMKQMLEKEIKDAQGAFKDPIESIDFDSFLAQSTSFPSGPAQLAGPSGPNSMSFGLGGVKASNAPKKPGNRFDIPPTGPSFFAGMPSSSNNDAAPALTFSPSVNRYVDGPFASNYARDPNTSMNFSRPSNSPPMNGLFDAPPPYASMFDFRRGPLPSLRGYGDTSQAGPSYIQSRPYRYNVTSAQEDSESSSKPQPFTSCVADSMPLHSPKPKSGISINDIVDPVAGKKRKSEEADIDMVLDAMRECTEDIDTQSMVAEPAESVAAPATETAVEEPTEVAAEASPVKISFKVDDGNASVPPMERLVKRVRISTPVPAPMDARRPRSRASNCGQIKRDVMKVGGGMLVGAVAAFWALVQIPDSFFQS